MYHYLRSKILSGSDFDFDTVALELFQFQAFNNPVYSRYLEILGIGVGDVHTLLQIPCLPIEVFKYREVKTGVWPTQVIFKSSGTTLDTFARHHVRDQDLYHTLAIETFESRFFPLKDVCILALLPHYLEAGDSSLVSMVSAFQARAQHPDSGFFLDDFDALASKLEKQNGKSEKTILFGVTYALLDFAMQFGLSLSPNIMVIETGGMKGRKEDMDRSALHEHLKKAFNINQIYSEYGMTELFSQAYAGIDGTFSPGRTMHVWIRELNDPFAFVPQGKVGAINVIDLANIDSCAFIATADLGRSGEGSTFEVLGRMDHADLRGCQLRYLEK